MTKGKSMEQLWQIEVNIDDMNPQHMEYVFQRLLTMGVNDVWAMPMMMKKSRLAVMLCVLCRQVFIEQALAVIFKETTSIGARYFPVDRVACQRKTETVMVNGQEIHCKISSYGGKITNISAEYDECCEAATRTGMSLKDLQRRAREEAYKRYGQNSDE
ncbi:MAG: LarC family nickel insertion protein [Megasphaera sp.]|nr:LarC family nickel insertion protein [Megasphaera sp.]